MIEPDRGDSVARGSLQRVRRHQGADRWRSARAAPGAGRSFDRVHAASVSYMDYLMICGGYQMRPALPYVPGTDAAGVVVACGEQVERFRPGDRVTCENWFGGFAERMTAKASKNRAASRQNRFHSRINAPARLSHGLVCARRSRAATGRRNRPCDRRVRRVGLACVELAHLLGARVIAGVGGAAKISDRPRIRC